MIGFGPCYHMVEVSHHPEHVPLWDAAADGRAVDWDAIFDGYRAAVDWPVCRFYRPLMERYPHAKVILTVRDPEAWYRSVQNTIHYRDPDDSPDGASPMQRMIDHVIWEGTFEGRMDDKAHALAVFDRHVQEVEATVPPERLLVYEAKDGWEPLCRFLGVPVPVDTPFPYLNTTAEWEKRREQQPEG
jgi:hypothetical protein